MYHGLIVSKGQNVGVIGSWHGVISRHIQGKTQIQRLALIGDVLYNMDLLPGAHNWQGIRGARPVHQQDLEVGT